MKRVFELITIGLVFAGFAGAEPEQRPRLRPGGQVPGKPDKPDKRTKPDKPGKPGKPGKLVSREEAWRRLDADGDGRVGYGEFVANERLQRVSEEARRRIFDRLDKNSDGLIQPDEMEPHVHGGGPDGEHRRPMWLGEMDKNHDGAIDFDEFCGGRMIARLPEEKQREVFERMDRDGNGRLDRADHIEGFRGGMPRLTDLDSDQSGGVSFEEFSAGEMATNLSQDRRRALFDRLDRNSNGQLGPDDLRGPGPGRGGPGGGFEAFDENGDKSLSFDEFRKAPWISGLGEDEQEDRFEELDRDGDLKLTPAEWEAGLKRGKERTEGKRPPTDQPGPGKRPEGRGEGRRAKPAAPIGRQGVDRIYRIS